MTPPGKPVVPFEADPAALHYRLTAVETRQEELLTAVSKNHRVLKRAIRKGFETCASSRPCAKAHATAVSFDWPAILPTLQKTLIGLAAIGTLIGAMLWPASGQKQDQQHQVTISQPANPASGK